MGDPSSVVLTLTHPLVARAEHPEAEALLAECCPHGAVPGLVRGGVVALFLPAPRSTLRVFVALVGRGAGQRLAPLRGPLHSTFCGRGTRSEVAHVVEGCDTVATTRRVLHATRHLHRVQPRGDVPGLQFLGPDREEDDSSGGSDSDFPDSDSSADSAPPSVIAAGADPGIPALDVPHNEFDEFDGSPYAPDPARGFGCSKDLDLSALSDPKGEFAFQTVRVKPRVLRFPQGHSAQMMRGGPFFSAPARRFVFHPDTLFTKIGSSVFCFADNLTTVDFRGLNNMPTFGNHLFQGCKKLTAVCMRGLPKLQSIGDCVFVLCGKLAFADCRDCPKLNKRCDRAFDGNAQDLCVLVDDEARRKTIRNSMAKKDRARAAVLTTAELAQRRTESGNAALHRCPVCECNDDAFEATFYDSSPSSDDDEDDSSDEDDTTPSGTSPSGTSSSGSSSESDTADSS